MPFGLPLSVDYGRPDPAARRVRVARPPAAKVVSDGLSCLINLMSAAGPGLVRNARISPASPRPAPPVLPGALLSRRPSPLMNTLLLVLILVLLLVPASHATVRLPRLVGDHMVLQRGAAVPIWGWADPGEAVTVTFRGRTYPPARPDAAG